MMQKCSTCGLTTCSACHAQGRYDPRHNLAGAALTWSFPSSDGDGHDASAPPARGRGRRGRGSRGRGRGRRGGPSRAGVTSTPGAPRRRPGLVRGPIEDLDDHSNDGTVPVSPGTRGITTSAADETATGSAAVTPTASHLARSAQETVGRTPLPSGPLPPRRVTTNADFPLKVSKPLSLLLPVWFYRP